MNVNPRVEGQGKTKAGGSLCRNLGEKYRVWTVAAAVVMDRRGAGHEDCEEGIRTGKMEPGRERGQVKTTMSVEKVHRWTLTVNVENAHRGTLRI